MDGFVDKEVESHSFLRDFLNANEIPFSEDFDLSKVCHMRAGGRCLFYISPKSSQDLESLIAEILKLDLQYLLVGRLSNTLFRSGVIRTILISTTKIKQAQFDDKNNLYLDCGVNLPKIAKTLTEQGYTGFGGLTGFPASIGGAIYMNASCYGNAISDFLVSVKCLALDGTVVTLSKSDVGFDWRYSKFHDKYKGYVILAATFQPRKMVDVSEKNHMILTKKNRTEFQEHKLPNLGSTFATTNIYKDIANSNRLYKFFYIIINIFSRFFGGKRDKVWAVLINKFTQHYFSLKEEKGVGFSDKTLNCVVNKSGAAADDIIEFVYCVEKEIGNVVDIEIIIYDKIY